MRGHKGIRPVSQSVMSGDQIEVLIRGQSYSCLNKERRRRRLGRIILLSFITAFVYYRDKGDWIGPVITLDLCVLVADLINENNRALRSMFKHFTIKKVVSFSNVFIPQ